MFRTFLIGVLAALAMLSIAPPASAMPVDTGAAASVAGSSATEVRLVCNRWGRCWRTRPAYYVPPVYFAPRVYVGPRRFYGPRYGAYRGGRHYYRGNNGWRHNRNFRR